MSNPLILHPISLILYGLAAWIFVHVFYYVVGGLLGKNLRAWDLHRVKKAHDNSLHNLALKLIEEKHTLEMKIKKDNAAGHTEFRSQASNMLKAMSKEFEKEPWLNDRPERTPE